VAGWQVRQLGPHDMAEAEQLVAGLGQEHLYLRNQLAAEQAGVAEGELLGVFGPEGLAAVAFFGCRGQIAAALADDAAVVPLCSAALRLQHDWRLFVGPAALARRLRAGLQRVRIFREQPFYLADPAALAPAGPGAEEVRSAVPQDGERVMLATIELNREDLDIPAERVSRERLREHVARRIADERVFVVGPPGRFRSKLELGSVGPGGVLIEGVYTFPDSRGRGLARCLVGALARRFTREGRVVGLHCAAGNHPARRVYESAGLRVAADWMLLLAEEP
jgi:ribosomal protein S18 acetylase RimI-like enzyme